MNTKGAFVDWINHVIYSFKWEKEVSSQGYFNHLSYDLDELNDITPLHLSGILSQAYSAEFSESGVDITTKATEKETMKRREKDLQRVKNYRQSALNRLKKACERCEENNLSILSYIERHKLQEYFYSD